MNDLYEMSESELMKAILQLSKRVTELKTLEEKALLSDTPKDSLNYLDEINELLEQKLRLQNRLNELLKEATAE